MRKLSIQAQLILIVLVSLVVFGIVTEIAHLSLIRQLEIESERKRALALANSVNTTLQAASPLTGTLDAIPELDTHLRALVDANKDIDFIAVTWPNGEVLFHSDPSYKARTVADLGNLPANDSVHKTLSDFGSVYLTSIHPNIPADEDPVQFAITVASAAEPVERAWVDSIVETLFTTLVALAVIGIAAYYTLRENVTLPIGRLTEAISRFGTGTLAHRIQPQGARELRKIAESFNQSADEIQRSGQQLEELRQTLEQRISERTRELATVAEVASQTATILDTDELLRFVCDLTKESFDLYHAHIYTFDPDREMLILTAGAGEIGQLMVVQGHQIPLNTPLSLVARAARTGEVVVVNNVAASPDFLPNPLLPYTQSELAVALTARGQLLGVLDVQSHEIDHFTVESRIVMETLARQIAAALSNAQLFSDLERSRRHAQVLSTITDRIQDATNIDEVLQTAARELGQALRVPHTTIELQLPSTEPEQE